MKRNVSLEEISDGRLYGRNDMVKAGCNNCRGCSACCHGMGESVIIDPYDAWRLSEGLSCLFAELLNDKFELNVVDGIILPNLKMTGSDGACGFLNQEGRCSIHPYRPGVCRLFPLGRYYENDGFQYFLQVHECPAKNKTKVKVEKWMDTPGLEQYDAYIVRWHYFLERIQKMLPSMSDEQIKNVNVYLLKLFFIKPYEKQQDFYSQFDERMNQAQEMIIQS